MNFFGKCGRAYRVERLSPRLAQNNVVGFYLNSPPRWLYCQTVVARNEEHAIRKARECIGMESQIRVTPEEDKGYL